MGSTTCSICLALVRCTLNLSSSGRLLDGGTDRLLVLALKVLMVLYPSQVYPAGMSTEFRDEACAHVLCYTAAVRGWSAAAEIPAFQVNVLSQGVWSLWSLCYAIWLVKHVAADHVGQIQLPALTQGSREGHMRMGVSSLQATLVQCRTPYSIDKFQFGMFHDLRMGPSRRDYLASLDQQAFLEPLLWLHCGWASSAVGSCAG